MDDGFHDTCLVTGCVLHDGHPGPCDIRHVGLGPTPTLPGYHLRSIPKGILGEISKIEEEFAEFLDATSQNVAVMQLVELSDLMGAIEAWLQKYHPNVTLDQLARMKDVTRRAFTNGKRKSG